MVSAQTRANQQSSASTIISTNGAHLHKLLVNSSGTNLTATPTILTAGSNNSELTRLPGGAELNILPAGSNGTPFYRGNGKLAIVNNGVAFKGKYFFNFFLRNKRVSGLHC